MEAVLKRGLKHMNTRIPLEVQTCFEEYQSSDRDLDIKMWISNRNREKFFLDYRIKKVAGTRDLSKFRKSSNIDRSISGIVPGFLLDRISYFIDCEDYLIIKAEPYELTKDKIVALVQFCNEKAWDFKIIQGYETWNPGSTFSIIVKTTLFL